MEKQISRWPSNERIAVLVTVMFEVWSEGKNRPLFTNDDLAKTRHSGLIGNFLVVGWFSPVAAPSVHTGEFLAEEGFLWHGDYNDTDLPYSFATSQRNISRHPAQ